MNMTDYVIADTVFGSPALWTSEIIFMSANRMGALKLPTGQNLSLFFCSKAVMR